MTKTDNAALEMDAEDLARGRELVQFILGDWDLMSWDELLADDVVLTLRLSAAGIDEVGDLAAIGGELEAVGREDAARVLRSIYQQLMGGLSVVTEMVSGYDVTLLGNWEVPSTKEDAESLSLPVALFMGFDDEGKIDTMTIATLDLQPMTEAIRAAVQSGAGQASAGPAQAQNQANA
jgi:hypothetical protein